MSNDILTEARFWMQVMGDAERTVICPPDLESRIKGWVSARGLEYLITVIADRYCPENKVFIVDQNAIDAAYNEVVSRPIRINWTMS